MFRFLVGYLKVFTIVIFAASIGSLFYKSFDPTFFMETQFSLTVFGQEKLATDVKKGFEFPFALFGVLSLSICFLQYFILHYGVRRGEKWAVHAMFLGALTWTVGAGGVALNLGYTFYILYSVLPFTLLFTLPIALLYVFPKR